jgi:AbrB family looped-hinge helix DNA binding protein
LSLVVVDDRGRIVIPSRLRRKLRLKKGDTFIIVDVKNNLLVLKRLDVDRLAREIAEEVARSGLDLEELGRRVEEEANKLAKEKIHD